MTDDSQGEDFAAMLAEFEREAPSGGRGPKVGDIITGEVLSIADDVVFIDLGGKSEGMLGIEQVSDRDGKVLVSVGDRVEARVVDTGDRSGVITLRRSVGKGPEASAELLQAHELGLPVEGLVTEAIKGGFSVQMAGQRAFCPISQIDSRFVEDAEQFVGRRFDFRITRYEVGSAGRSNLVVSRRVLLEEEAAAKAAETRAILKVGVVLPGVVTTIKDYGAFVDIGGLEGMLHISELGFARVAHPSDVLSVGQGLNVQVLKIENTGDAKRPEKISLSLKSLESDPWSEAAASMSAGARASAVITRIQPFGAFAELAPGVEGLIHISEMGQGKRINSPREVVAVGDEVTVTVLSIDSERRRLSLSLDAAAREAAAAEEAQTIAEHAPTQANMGTFADLFKERFGKK